MPSVASTTPQARDIHSTISASWSDWPLDTEWIVRHVCSTIRDMLSARGYESTEGATCAAEVNETIRQGQPTITAGPNSEVVVYFLLEDRVSVKTVRSMLDVHSLSKNIMLLSVDGFTPFAKKELLTYNGVPIVEGFNYRNCVHPVVDHTTVGWHRREQLPPSEDVTNYPTMSSTDVISQYYGFLPGDIVSCQRYVGTTDPITFYRRVVLST